MKSKIVNEFYSIANEGGPLEHEFQLANLGTNRVSMSFGFVKRDGYGGTKHIKHDINQAVTAEDYDHAFVSRISRIKPAYALENFLDFHYQHYSLNNPSGITFIKHIRYVVLPLLKKRNNSEVFIELLQNWIKSVTMEDIKNEFGNTSISGSNNVVNIASGNINQSGISLNYSQSDSHELQKLGVDDKEIADLKEIIETNHSDKPTMTSKAFKWISDLGKSLAVKGLRTS